MLALAAVVGGAQTVSKEYIRLGGQVIAIENNSAVVTVSPSSLSFGDQTVALAGASQTVTVMNSGNTAAATSVASPSGTNASDFAVSGNTCGTSLAAAANCMVSVYFAPSATGTRSANLLITAAGTVYTVALTGTGIPSGAGHQF